MKTPRPFTWEDLTGLSLTAVIGEKLPPPKLLNFGWHRGPFFGQNEKCALCRRFSCRNYDFHESWELVSARRRLLLNLNLSVCERCGRERYKLLEDLEHPPAEVKP